MGNGGKSKLLVNLLYSQAQIFIREYNIDKSRSIKKYSTEED